MVDELSRRLALCFPNRLEDAGFGDTAEIVVDRGLPAGLDHVEPDGAGQNIGLVEPSLDAMGGGTALIVAVGRLVDGIDGKRRTVGEQGRLSRAVEGGERIPEVLLVLGQPRLPGLMPRLDGFRGRAFP